MRASVSLRFKALAVLAVDSHTGSYGSNASSLVRRSVDGDQALEADADSAVEAARLSLRGVNPKCASPVCESRSGDRFPFVGDEFLVVEADTDPSAAAHVVTI